MHNTPESGLLGGVFMNHEKPLSDLYKLYKTGDLSRKDLEGRIFQHLLDSFEKYRLFRGSREKWNDFLSWLYPRISRAIELYRDLGSSLDAYITALVHGASKEYRSREANHYLIEYACWRARAEEMKAHENEPVYQEGRNNITIPFYMKPRQVLFLLLKSYFFVTDELVEQVAGIVGMETEEIRRMIDELRKRRSEQEEEILNLRDRLQCQYYRCLAYQKQMKSAFPGTEYYEKLEERFERARKRFYGMKKRLGGMRKGASNRLIAEVLGIPKGTVDSGLYAIKNQLGPARHFPINGFSATL